MKYRQLTQTQRYQISALRVAGKSQRQIAGIIGCHSSTVSRELKRNSTSGYDPEHAQQQSNARRSAKDAGLGKIPIARALNIARKKFKAAARWGTGKATQLFRATSNLV